MMPAKTQPQQDVAQRDDAPEWTKFEPSSSGRDVCRNSRPRARSRRVAEAAQASCDLGTAAGVYPVDPARVSTAERVAVLAKGRPT